MHCKVTDDLASALPQLPQLRQINVLSTGVTMRGVDELFQRQGKSVALEEYGGRVPEYDSARADFVAKNTPDDGTLTAGWFPIDDNMLIEWMPHGKRIERVHLQDTCVTGRFLRQCVFSNAVIEVNLSSTLLDDAGARCVLQFPRLRQLDVSDTKVTDLTVSGDGDSALEELILTRCQIGESACDDIARLRNLRVLGLNGTGLSRSCILRIVGNLPLETLRIDAGTLTQVDLESMSTRGIFVIED
jgi:hypothetical protein